MGLWYTRRVEREQRIAELEAENRGLRERLESALKLIEELQSRIGELEKRLGERSKEMKGGDDPPPFAKPNRPKTSDSKPRKRRAKAHNQVRRRETPTKTVLHRLETCPNCQSELSEKGERLVYSRQVIELPEPVAVEVIEHRVIRRKCPKCKAYHRPKLDLQAEGVVLGRGRMGVRLCSLIAYLRTSLRLPLSEIQSYLETVHQFKVSEGELVYLLDQVEKATRPEVEVLKEQVRRSPIVHADETGWREDGVNGYIWSFSTPGCVRSEPGDKDGAAGEGAIRYFERDRSRSHEVVRRILGGKFKGHLVSDFYSGYNDYGCPKQRCWSHFLRDLHDLKEANPKHKAVQEWAKAIRALYDEATRWVSETHDPSQEAREREYRSLVEQAHKLGLRYAQDKTHPAWALSKRVLRHEDELFQFVRVSGLASNNNLAERSLRSLVIGRKISGGTRSKKGSKIRMALASLFETWKARGLNPFAQCLSLLSRLPVPTPV
jgi:transposase